MAGLRSNRGASFQILRAIRDRDIRIAVSVALVLEYESVVLRPGLLPHFTADGLAELPIGNRSGAAEGIEPFLGALGGMVTTSFGP